MPRLIDVSELQELKWENPGTDWCRGWNTAIDAVVGYAPTVEAEPVRHGRWRRERNPMMYQVVPYVFVCDQCGTAFEYDTPYCGECGAKMDEVEDG